MLLSLLAVAAAHSGNDHCGTRHPTAEEKQEDAQIWSNFKNNVCAKRPQTFFCDKTAKVEKEDLRYDINLAFHIIYDGATNQGRLTEREVQEQFDVVQEDFSGDNSRGPGYQTRFTFNLANVTYTDNALWFSRPQMYERDFKNALAIDPPNTVNQYFTDMSAGLLGWCYFPNSFPESSPQHGCVNLYSSVPGGSSNNYNLGATTTHEMGHGFGLYHVFDGSCDCEGSRGDQVADTNCQISSTNGCPSSQSTCGTPDNINNFMDYSYDRCMYLFTEGQSRRMDEQVALHRPSLLSGFRAAVEAVVPNAWEEAEAFQLRMEKKYSN